MREDRPVSSPSDVPVDAVSARRPAPWRRCRLGLGRRGRRRVVRAGRRARAAGAPCGRGHRDLGRRLIGGRRGLARRRARRLGRSRRGWVASPGIGSRRRGRCRARRRLPRRGPALGGWPRWPAQVRARSGPGFGRGRRRATSPASGPGLRGDRLDVLGLTLRRRRDAGRLVDRTGVAADLRARHLRAHDLSSSGGTSLQGFGRPCGFCRPTDGPAAPGHGRGCHRHSTAGAPVAIATAWAPPPPPVPGPGGRARDSG